MHRLFSFILVESSYSPAIFCVTGANLTPNLEETMEGEEQASEVPASLDEWTAEDAV